VSVPPNRLQNRVAPMALELRIGSDFHIFERTQR